MGMAVAAGLAGAAMRRDVSWRLVTVDANPVVHPNEAKHLNGPYHLQETMHRLHHFERCDSPGTGG